MLLVTCCLCCAVNNLTKTQVRNKKKQELIELCEDLGIDTTDCDLKPDYVKKVLAFMDQQRQRTGSSTSQQSSTEALETKQRVGADGD